MLHPSKKEQDLLMEINFKINQDLIWMDLWVQSIKLMIDNKITFSIFYKKEISFQGTEHNPTSDHLLNLHHFRMMKFLLGILVNKTLKTTVMLLKLNDDNIY